MALIADRRWRRRKLALAVRAPPAARRPPAWLPYRGDDAMAQRQEALVGVCLACVLSVPGPSRAQAPGTAMKPGGAPPGPTPPAKSSTPPAPSPGPPGPTQPAKPAPGPGQAAAWHRPRRPSGGRAAARRDAAGRPAGPPVVEHSSCPHGLVPRPMARGAATPGVDAAGRLAGDGRGPGWRRRRGAGPLSRHDDQGPEDGADPDGWIGAGGREGPSGQSRRRRAGSRRGPAAARVDAAHPARHHTPRPVRRPDPAPLRPLREPGRAPCRSRSP